MKDNLDGFQKLVSTQWTFSILIWIGLDRRDPQPYSFYELNLNYRSNCIISCHATVGLQTDRIN